MSVDPRQRHQKKQSWWKKSNRRTNPKRTRTFNNNTNPSQDNNNNPNNPTTEALRIPPNSSPNPHNPSSHISMNENSQDILSTDPEILTPRQIRTLQTELSRVIKLNHQLEMELNLRASQVEQMEDNLRLVADQSKMIGVRAMEQEQKLLEIKKALELKTKQLALFRGSQADRIPLNEITVLPFHLRGKFSEFLRGILLSQKKFFESALKDFVANQITDRELTVNDQPLTRNNLLLEIAKIGNSLAFDFMSELELRLNGTFSSHDTKYTLHNGQDSLEVGGNIHMSYTPKGSPNPPAQHMIQQRPVSPMYSGGHMNNNTLSSQGPPMISMNAPSHTPMGSVGSAGAMTPQTSISTTATTNDNENNKRKKVKTGGAFDKAKKLLSSKKKKKKQQQQQQQQQQQMQQQQQQQMQMQQQQQQQQMQYPPPTYHQYPSMGMNGHHQYPPQPSMKSIPSSDLKTVSNDREKANNIYNFHKSATSTQNSAGNVAMEALMKEIADAEEHSGSVVIRDHDHDDDDINTDDDFSSGDVDNDDDDEKIDSGVIGIPRILSNASAGSNGDLSDDSDEDDDQFDENPDAQAMQQQLLSMTKQHTQAILSRHGADGSNELNKMWSQFVQFKKGMSRPTDAPLAFTVPDKTSSFVELRDLLEALPFDLSCAILQDQQMNPYDRIKDVTIQRGCWPMVRYVRNNRVQTINKVFLRFDDVLRRLEMYLQNEKDKSNGPQLLNKEHLEMMNGNNSYTNTNMTKKLKPAGNQLLGALDPQKTTGFRLHQITSIIRQRNEARDTITALNLRVGRLWNMDTSHSSICENLITDSIDFFQSLDNPSTMLLLGPNTAEKCALCREICKQLSSAPINMRTALVDTRSTVGGFTKSPIETGQTIRFYVNSVTNQSNQINATRSIYPQVVCVDEVLSLSDIESIGKLQSEGISVIVGTNMHSLEALLGHPLYSQLLPPQDRLIVTNHNQNHNQYSTMSPHLLILEMNTDGTNVKMYKNIPDAVKAIKRFSQPQYKQYKLKWQGYNTNDTGAATKYINHQLHKRTTSKMVSKLMKDTLSYKNIPNAL